MSHRFLSLLSLLALTVTAARAHDPSASDVHKLDTFVTTGTRTERAQSNVPVKTDVFLASEIEVFGGVTLADSLRLIPSARFESDCQNCGLNQIQLLGLSTDYTAILFDGAPLYSGLAKIYGASLFPTIFVDHIEVVKGGSSVLYGAEAIAGVVNLVTIKPVRASSRVETTLSQLAGEARDFEFAARTSQVSADGHTAATAYAFYQDRQGLDLTTDGFTELPQFKNKVAGLQLFHTLREDSELRATYQYLDETHRGGDQLDLPEEQARVAESLAHRIHTLGLGWEQRVNPDLTFQLRGSFLSVARNAYYGARADAESLAYAEAGQPAPDLETFASAPANQAGIDAVAHRIRSETDNEVYFLDAQFTHRIADAHELVYGAQHRTERLSEHRPYDPAIADTNSRFSTWGVFVQDIWTVNPHLELVPGLRFDRHDYVSGTIFSPRLALRYHTANDLTVRASFSTGFNAPGAYNEDAHIGVSSGGGILLTNSLGLKEENSRTFSLGADWLVPSQGHRLALSSTIHATRLRDTFDIDDTDPINWLRVNGPHSKVFVWENGFGWLLAKHLRLDASVSYINARFDEPVARVTGLVTRDFVERPKWTGVATLVYNLPKQWEAHALVNYTGSMLAVGEESATFRASTPTFWEVDLGVARTIRFGEKGPYLKIGVGVRNLFDQRQRDIFNNGEDRDPTYLYGPVRPRTLYVNAGFAF